EVGERRVPARGRRDLQGPKHARLLGRQRDEPGLDRQPGRGGERARVGGVDQPVPVDLGGGAVPRVGLVEPQPAGQRDRSVGRGGVVGHGGPGGGGDRAPVDGDDAPVVGAERREHLDGGLAVHDPEPHQRLALGQVGAGERDLPPLVVGRHPVPGGHELRERHGRDGGRGVDRALLGLPLRLAAELPRREQRERGDREPDDRHDQGDPPGPQEEPHTGDDTDPMRGALLVAGTTSDAGKSALVTGICRLLARRGVPVAPFKAQNMSNNSVVTPDGGEIGRAQAVQALACGLEPSVAFNPVLLKPGSDRSSQVVVRGRVDGTVDARTYQGRKAALLDVVTASLAELRARFDVVVCEGAGSPAEINLRANDIANMGLAQAADLPVVIVGDIDRGGVLAHLFGTVAVLDPADQARVAGFVVNKFRGDPALLAPGLDQLAALTGRPTLGVLPWEERLWLDAEDSLSAVADGVLGRPSPPLGSQWLRVAVVRLPRISNATDAEALAAEPGVAVRYVTEPSRLADADLVVLPGSKATVADLAWLRRAGLADAVVAHARAGRPVLGICGGYQMLGTRILDPHGVEGGDAEGLGLLDL